MFPHLLFIMGNKPHEGPKNRTGLLKMTPAQMLCKRKASFSSVQILSKYAAWGGTSSGVTWFYNSLML